MLHRRIADGQAGVRVEGERRREIEHCRPGDRLVQLALRGGRLFVGGDFRRKGGETLLAAFRRDLMPKRMSLDQLA